MTHYGDIIGNANTIDNGYDTVYKVKFTSREQNLSAIFSIWNFFVENLFSQAILNAKIVDLVETINFSRC